MRQHCENAGILADWLQDRALIEQVFYPGLESHPTHHIAAQQMSGYGGIVRFQVHGGEVSARRVAEATNMFVMSARLSGIEAAKQHPVNNALGLTKGAEGASLS